VLHGKSWGASLLHKNLASVGFVEDSEYLNDSEYRTRSRQDIRGQKETSVLDIA